MTIVARQFRWQIPVDFRIQYDTIQEEIKYWLEMQHITAHVTLVLKEPETSKLRYELRFDNPTHETLFRLKYSEYIVSL